MSAVPKFMGRVNRRIFNPREIRKGKRPVLIHRGRTSGNEYLTPLDAHRVDEGFMFIVMYGSDCDWVQNVLASGSATLRVDGHEVPLEKPRLVSVEEATKVLSSIGLNTSKLSSRAEYLRMDAVGDPRNPGTAPA